MNATATLTTSAPSTAPTGTYAAIIESYRRAHERAVAVKLVAYRNDDGSYDVPSVSTPGEVHLVTVTGQRWFDLACSCKGGNHIACQHRAVVVHARKYHVRAVRPAPPVLQPADQRPTVSPEELAKVRQSPLLASARRPAREGEQPCRLCGGNMLHPLHDVVCG